MSDLVAKFRVTSVTREIGESEKILREQVSLIAVYSSDKNSENYQWSQYTPAGNLALTITNPNAFGKLKMNKDYILEFNEVE
jgi:hypothetical protein